jgi:hypothetical protein
MNTEAHLVTLVTAAAEYDQSYGYHTDERIFHRQATIRPSVTEQSPHLSLSFRN